MERKVYIIYSLKHKHLHCLLDGVRRLDLELGMINMTFMSRDEMFICYTILTNLLLVTECIIHDNNLLFMLADECRMAWIQI